MIALRGVRFGYAGRPLFEGLDQTFPEGRVTALAGPNGTGKSTLLKLAAGLLVPCGGSVSLGGRELAPMHPSRRAKEVAYLPQSPLLPAEWTVREVVEAGNYPHELHPPEPSPLEARMERARREMGLEACWEKPTGQVSGGEAQRAVLARALVQGTRVLLLDEPCSHQDLKRQVSLYALLRSLSSEGKTVVVTTHDVNLPRQFGFGLRLLDGRGAVHEMPTGRTEQRELLESVYQTHMACAFLGQTPCWFPQAGLDSQQPFLEGNRTSKESGDGEREE